MMLRRPIALLFMAFLSACNGSEVTGPRTTLTGTVINRATAAPIAGASVSFGSRTATTGSNGRFVLEELPAGEMIELVASRDGYDTETVLVVLNVGTSTTTIPLRPKTSGVVDSVGLFPVTNPVRMTGPGSIRIGAKVYFAGYNPIGQGQLDTTTIDITTTGPVTAKWELGYTGWRALVVSVTGPGTGTVSVSHRGGKATSISVDAVDPRFRRLSVGSGIGCALADDDLAWCWGGNMSGALGVATLGKCNGSACQYGGNDGNPTPLPVSGGMKFSQVATAGYLCTTNGFNSGICGRTCALTESGEAWCWGDGMGSSPKRVAASLTFKSLSMRPTAAESCGLTLEGKAYCFTATTTTPIASDKSFQSLAVGTMHSCGVDLSGDAYCWGSNTYAGLGIGAADTAAHPNPVKVQTDARFTAIGVGRTSSCGLQTTGAVLCWGFVGTQFQNDNCTTSPTGCLFLPQAVTGGGAGYSGIAKAGLGPEVCAMTNAGAVDCWTTPTNSPTQPFPEPMVSVGVGTFTSGFGGTWCGVSTAGLLYCGRMPQPATRFP